MDTPIALHLPGKVLLAFIMHTGEGCYGEKSEAILCQLINQWIATTEATPCPWDAEVDDVRPANNSATNISATNVSATNVSAADASEGRGYQWKELFLPDGTELRVTTRGRATYAKVENEQIISEGVSLTPSRLANAGGCGTRSAWRCIWLRFPGSGRWELAAKRRAMLASTASLPQ